jgi:hypothetical protein
MKKGGQIKISILTFFPPRSQCIAMIIRVCSTPPFCFAPFSSMVPIICQGIPGRHSPYFYLSPFFVLLSPAILGLSLCVLREKASFA